MSDPRAKADRPRVLCLDDEPQVLESLRDSLRRRFDVVVTTKGFEALKLLVDEPFDVVVSDMRMPMLDGARFLMLARDHAPDTVRVLLTGHSTLDDAVIAVNEAEIFRFLIKPIATEALVVALDAAVARRHRAVRQRAVDEEAVNGTVRALRDVAAAAEPGPARPDRLRRLALEIAAVAEGVVRTDELERACELMGIGSVALSLETRTHIEHGRRLGHDQVAELERLPEYAEPFLRPIPQLKTVAALLGAAGRAFVPTTHGVAGTAPAARVLRIALDYELLERQAVPSHAAVAALRARAGRYDPKLLDILETVVTGRYDPR